jgi:hypothetical protein
MAAWHSLFDAARPAFAQQRTFDRARGIALAALACLGRRTLSGLLCASGQQFHDWSAAYRLFEKQRVDTEPLWNCVQRQVLAQLPDSAPVVALIDDTLCRKRGKQISGTSWRRDPLGPAFADNFIWASRFLQLSLALPAHPEQTVSPARAIPVDLQHAPSPRKPSKRAPEEVWKSWRAAAALSTVSSLGAQRIAALRSSVDASPGGKQRQLLVCADATFTCRAVFKGLPERTTLIGRIRKDACFYALPTAEEENRGRGRRRAYGQRLPTPEQYRQDQSIPWQTVRACAAGNTYDFDIKIVSPLRWKHAGGERQLLLLVVRPVAYRLKQGADLNYRRPAYLICTDPTLAPQQILQAYLWRWEIEVNFRDEKTLLGFGEPQVRTATAVRTTAAFYVFTYAILLLALQQCQLAHTPLPPPLWQRRKPKRPLSRVSTPQAISLFRADLWSAALGLTNKNGFVVVNRTATKPPQIQFALKSAVLYATG